MKKLIIFLLCIFFLFPLFSVSPNIIPLSSPLYRNIDSLYSLCGLSYPSGARPWSEGEAKEILYHLDSLVLSQEEKELYEEVKNIIDSYKMKWETNGFGASATISLNPEFYFHTNPDTFSANDYWVVDYEHRTPFLNGSLSFSAKDFFYTYCDAQLTEEFGYGDFSGFLFYNNGVFENRSDIPWDGKSGIGEDISYSYPLLPDRSVWIAVSTQPYNRKSSFNISTFDALSLNFPRRAFVSFGNNGWMYMAL